MSRDHSSLIDVLRHRAETAPAQRAFTFLADGERESEWLTYGELDERARALAMTLVEQGVAPGDRAILLYPPGLEFVSAFFGALYAGVAAVPCYPPQPSQLARALPRLLAVIGDAEASVVLCPRNIAMFAPAIAEHAPKLAAVPWLATDDQPMDGASRWTHPEVSPSTLAFLQYTSGSTSAPRGVMVTHGNLLHNLSYISFAAEHGDDSRSVSWLPVIHDMGLIEGVLGPVFGGYPGHLMAPTAFLQRPIRWLRAITNYRATTSGGPNFAYDLCVRKISDEHRTSLDLSTWRAAYNGAEPIRAETLRAFHDRFRGCGFRWRSFYPVYGLAEGTLVVTTGRQSYEPVIRDVERGALAAGHVRPIERANGGEHDDVTRMVSSGSPLFGTDLRIVDPETCAPKPDGSVGEIWIASPSVAGGYWRRPEETMRTFGAVIAGDLGDDGHRYLRTGDLGTLVDGELFVAGRLKDMLIVRGMKFAPQDLEATAECSHDSIRRGCVAAFSIPGLEMEQVVVAAELDPRLLTGRTQGDLEISPNELTLSPEIGAMAAVVEAVRAAIWAQQGIQLDAVALLRPGRIPKTSSGKIRRHACAQSFAARDLDELHRWESIAASLDESAALLRTG